MFLHISLSTSRLVVSLPSDLHGLLGKHMTAEVLDYSAACSTYLLFTNRLSRLITLAKRFKSLGISGETLLHADD